MSSSGMSPFYPLFILSAPTLLIATAVRIESRAPSPKPAPRSATNLPSDADPEPFPLPPQALSLHQFKMFYIAFINLANERSGNALWMMVQPFIKDLARVMEGVLGNAYSFKPGLTHVMLTALMLAIIVSLERVRSAVVASKRGSTRLD